MNGFLRPRSSSRKCGIFKRAGARMPRSIYTVSRTRPATAPVDAKSLDLESQSHVFLSGGVRLSSDLREQQGWEKCQEAEADGPPEGGVEGVSARRGGDQQDTAMKPTTAIRSDSPRRSHR